MIRMMFGLGLAITVFASIASADCPNSTSCSADTFSCGNAHYASCTVYCYEPTTATCIPGSCTRPFPTPNNCYCRKPQ